MRSNFITRAASSDPVSMLSLEEQELAIAETVADAHGITSTIDAVNDIVDKTDALEDVAVIADGIDQTTEAEANLITTVGQIVGGGQYDRNEVVPVMENYLGKRIATESIREKASEMYERIIKFLKSIYEKIEKFFHNHFGTLPRIQKRLKDLEKKIQDHGGKSLAKDKEKITLSSGLSSLHVGGKYLKDEASISQSLTDMLDIISWSTTSYADSVNELGDKIVDAINDFEPKHAAKQATDFAEILKRQTNGLGKLPKAKPIQDGKRWPGFKVLTSAPLMGGISVYLKTSNDSVKEGVLGQLDRYRRFGAVVESTDTRSGNLESSIEIKTLSLSSMLNLVETCQEIVRKMENYQRGKQLRESLDKRKKIETATAAMAKNQSRAENSDDPDEKHSVPYYKAFANFNIAYANWVSNPNVQLMVHATSAVRLIIALIEKSLSSYE